MEWFSKDSDTGEMAKWWSIDPQTGEPDGDASRPEQAPYCLGDGPLDAVAQSVDAIETIFAISRCFSEAEVRALLVERVVPPSFGGGPEDAAELLELVECLWEGAGACYQEALNRPVNPVERQWLLTYALKLLCPKSQ
jgi:hypothetical protein